MALEPSEETLLAAVTKRVKVITDMNDVVVTFGYFVIVSNVTRVLCNTALRESKSKSALKRLNASMHDSTFSSNMSLFLGVSLKLAVSDWSKPGESVYRPEESYLNSSPSSKGQGQYFSRSKKEKSR